MNRDDEPPRRPSNPMGQKPRVPVGPRRSTTSPPTTRESTSPGASAPTKPSTSASKPTSNATPPARASSAPTRVSRPKNTAPPARRARRIALFASLAIVALALAGGGAFAGLLWYYGRDLPDVHQLRARWTPPQTTRILARDGSVLAELFLERRTVVPLSRVPENLVKAVLAAEDAEFYRHHGLNYLGILRALFVDIRRGATVQGASTITQQVVKNVLLTPERTLARKMRELVLAERIERELSKNEILFLYLNDIGFGHGRNGVEEAAQFYFGKHVDQLTLAECALLAGIPKNPTHYSPRLHPDAALTRRHWILGRMVVNGFVTQAEADAADHEPIRLAETEEDTEGIAPEVVEAARAALRGTAGEGALRAGGFTVTTTIDPALQREARAAVQSGLRDLDTRQGYYGPLLAPGERRVRGHNGYVLQGEPPPADGHLLPGHIYGGQVEEAIDPDPAQHRDGAIVVLVGNVRGRVPWSTVGRYVHEDMAPSAFAPRGASVRVSVAREATADAEMEMRLELGPQGALVAIEPRTREVRAIVGGYDAVAGMFDRASHALRQPGSSFKPYLYSYALSTRRYTLASTVDPNPTCFDRWCPHEDHPSPPGAGPEPPMRLRDALAYSRNLVAARMMMDLGPQAVADHAHAIGIHAQLAPVPSLALGTSEVTLIDHANAYATWDDAGHYAPPTLIRSIVGPDHRTLVPAPADTPHDAVTPDEAWIVTSLLTSVIQTPRGTGARARELHRPVAGKTGTSNEERDAWFIGYTPDLVCGVWVGFDDRQPLGHGEEGARSALPIWVQFMRRYVAIAHPPPLEFPRPADIVVAHIDPASGLLARPDQTDATDEYFLPGSEPHAIAAPNGDAGANWFTSTVAGDAGGIALEAPEAPDAGAPAVVLPSDAGVAVPTAAPAPAVDASRGDGP